MLRPGLDDERLLLGCFLVVRTCRALGQSKLRRPRCIDFPDDEALGWFLLNLNGRKLYFADAALTLAFIDIV